MATAITATEVWSDLHHDIIIGPQGGVKKVINIDAVKTSIDNILRTSKGERVMRRGFGSNLKNMVFENLDSEFYDAVNDRIKDAITTWDNRVIVNSIDVKMNSDRNEVYISMSFSIAGYDKIFSLSTSI